MPPNRSQSSGPGEVYRGKSGRRGTYFRDPDGHLMEIVTDAPGEPA